MAVRRLAVEDLDTITAWAHQRRAALAPFAPLFWRSAADAVVRHRAFFACLLEDDGNMALRTDHGFLLALPRDDGWFVDDFVVMAPATYADEGAALLDAMLDARVRIVLPVAEPDKMQLAHDRGFVDDEVWWHRDLPTQPLDVSAHLSRGRLVDAPPVYDPGGPVLLVSEVDSTVDLRRLEDEAAGLGARVSVVSQQPHGSALEETLTRAGYRRTTVYAVRDGSPTASGA